ncbi:MAG: hypothetical protein ACREMR_06930 [Gemmatimonadales bacterium]
MPEFETIFKFFVLFGGFMGIIVAAGFGFKRVGQKPTEDPRVLDKLTDLEARLGDIEERLDFTERALTDLRGRVQIPPKV